MPKRFFWSLCAAVALVAACGGSAPFPVEVGGATVPAHPERIVSLSATHTEMLFAIGAGGQVVATDATSDYPPEALETEKVDAFQPNVEAIAAMNPDLVVVWFDPGDLVTSLQALGIPVVRFDTAADLEDAYGQLEELGEATGRSDEAGQLVADMREEIEDIRAAAPDFLRAPTYYHELDPNLFTVTSDTFAGAVYGLLGLENVADAAGAEGISPQLSAEYIIEADPDYIFLADTKCCGVDAKSLADRPGWEALSAVQMGNVVELDDAVASRWGPRVVEFLRTVAEAL